MDRTDFTFSHNELSSFEHAVTFHVHATSDTASTETFVAVEFS